MAEFEKNVAQRNKGEHTKEMRQFELWKLLSLMFLFVGMARGLTRREGRVFTSCRPARSWLLLNSSYKETGGNPLLLLSRLPLIFSFKTMALALVYLSNLWTPLRSLTPDWGWRQPVKRRQPEPSRSLRRGWSYAWCAWTPPQRSRHHRRDQPPRSSPRSRRQSCSRRAP